MSGQNGIILYHAEYSVPASLRICLQPGEEDWRKRSLNREKVFRRRVKSFFLEWGNKHKYSIRVGIGFKRTYYRMSSTIINSTFSLGEAKRITHSSEERYRLLNGCVPISFLKDMAK